MAKKTKSYSQVQATDELEPHAVYYTKLFTTSWQLYDNISSSLCSLNNDAVWENIVAFVGEMEVDDGQIHVDEEYRRLMRQI